VTDLN